ncbi:hypothetical protein BG262_01205 [Floricoccus penangensis]|uniref:Uncharacterized protein n=1 Tax=Floricoccus penangensis TaxID=1859475 RepID=A0A9Q5JHG1_9LACT|nr:hypothetical protein [Floricoccus penangensis]OFI47271.1 hypothetical protein BG262_01205 [Floricoccus penangensis]
MRIYSKSVIILIFLLFSLMIKVGNGNAEEINSKNYYEYTIRTQDDLDKLVIDDKLVKGDILFDLSEDVVFPRNKEYILDKPLKWYFSPNKNARTINFNYSKIKIKSSGYFNWYLKEDMNLSYKNLTITGSVSNEKYDFGGFNAMLLKVKNSKFQNLTFNQALAKGSHIFDLSNCSFNTFDKIGVYGYGVQNEDDIKSIESKSKDLLKEPLHDLFAEAIQFDIGASDGAFGTGDKLISKVLFFEDVENDKYGITNNIEVKNSMFLPYVGKNGDDKLVISKYGSSIGSHTGYDINNIIILDNVFQNIIYPLNKPATGFEKIYYPIHFLKPSKNIELRNNVFIATKGVEIIDGIINYD